MAFPGTSRNRTRTTLLVLVIAVALLVLAAVYAILTAPMPRPPPPFVELSEPAFSNPGSATISVTEASREVPLRDFRVELRDVYAGTTVFAATLAPGLLYSDGGATSSFNDVNSPDALGLGDTFQLDNFPTGVTYSLLLIYIPGDRSVASATVPL